MLNGLQNLDLLALLPDPQTVVSSALWQQLANDGLQDEPLNPAPHGVGDFAGFGIRVFIFRIYTKGGGESRPRRQRVRCSARPPCPRWQASI